MDCYDIFIQAGQSNAEGSGFGPASDPWYPDDRVYYLEPDMTLIVIAHTAKLNKLN